MQIRILRIAAQRFNLSLKEAAQLFKKFDVLRYIREGFGIFHVEGDEAVFEDVKSSQIQRGYRLMQISDWFKISDKTLFSMDLVAMMAVEDIAEREQKSKEDVLISFMESNTAKMLYDDSTKLWWDGPAATAEEYEKETKKL